MECIIDSLLNKRAIRASQKWCQGDQVKMFRDGTPSMSSCSEGFRGFCLASSFSSEQDVYCSSICSPRVSVLLRCFVSIWS